MCFVIDRSLQLTRQNVKLTSTLKFCVFRSFRKDNNCLDTSLCASVCPCVWTKSTQSGMYAFKIDNTSAYPWIITSERFVRLRLGASNSIRINPLEQFDDSVPHKLIPNAKIIQSTNRTVIRIVLRMWSPHKLNCKWTPITEWMPIWMCCVVCSNTQLNGMNWNKLKRKTSRRWARTLRN